MGAEHGVNCCYKEVVFDAWIEARVWGLVVTDHDEGWDVLGNIAAIVHHWRELMSFVHFIRMQEDLPNKDKRPYPFSIQHPRSLQAISFVVIDGLRIAKVALSVVAPGLVWHEPEDQRSTLKIVLYLNRRGVIWFRKVQDLPLIVECKSALDRSGRQDRGENCSFNHLIN